MLSQRSLSYRHALDRLLVADGNTVADYRADVGVTGTLAVSSWANQLGSAPALAQATGGNQPIYLPFAGQKYLYSPSVSGNNASTPHIAAHDFGAGSYAIEAKLRLYSNGAFKVAVGFAQVGGWRCFITSGNALGLWWGNDGQRYVAVSTATLSTGTDYHCIWGYNATTGKVYFSVNGSYNEATEANNPVTGGTTLMVGSDAQPAYQLDGLVYYANVFNRALTSAECASRYAGGTDGSANIITSFNPALSTETTTNGATWTSSTGETWTLNCTGSKPAQIVGSSQLLFDGTAHYLATGAFTLNQPETVYLVYKTVSWTGGDSVFDGNTTNTMRLLQNDGGGYVGASPNMQMYAGGYLANSSTGMSGPAVNAYGVVNCVFNGASSVFQLNNASERTGNAGASNAGGFQLGTGNSTFANMQVKEAIVRSAADSAATRALIYQYLRAIHGTP